MPNFFDLPFTPQPAPRDIYPYLDDRSRSVWGVILHSETSATQVASSSLPQPRRTVNSRLIGARVVAYFFFEFFHRWQQDVGQDKLDHELWERDQARRDLLKLRTKVSCAKCGKLSITSVRLASRRCSSTVIAPWSGGKVPEPLEGQSMSWDSKVGESGLAMNDMWSLPRELIAAAASAKRCVRAQKQVIDKADSPMLLDEHVLP